MKPLKLILAVSLGSVLWAGCTTDGLKNGQFSINRHALFNTAEFSKIEVTVQTNGTQHWLLEGVKSDSTRALDTVDKIITAAGSAK